MANCPKCNTPGAYIGMKEIECKNPNCEHFVIPTDACLCPCCGKPEGLCDGKRSRPGQGDTPGAKSGFTPGRLDVFASIPKHAAHSGEWPSIVADGVYFLPSEKYSIRQAAEFARQNKVCVITACQKTSMSTFMLDHMRKLAQQGVPVLHCSLEMSLEEVSSAVMDAIPSEPE